MDTHPIEQYRKPTPPTPGHAQVAGEREIAPGTPHENPTPLRDLPVVSDTTERADIAERIPASTYRRNVQQSAKTLADSIFRSPSYSPQYVVDMLDYFTSREKNRTVTDYLVYKHGGTGEKERVVANPPPMFSEFARMIGVSKKTLQGWAKKHAEFRQAWEMCEDIIQEFIVENGVAGHYSGQLTVFIAKNITGMKDTVVTESRNLNVRDFLDRLEKGAREIGQDNV